MQPNKHFKYFDCFRCGKKTLGVFVRSGNRERVCYDCQRKLRIKTLVRCRTKRQELKRRGFSSKTTLAEIQSRRKQKGFREEIPYID